MLKLWTVTTLSAIGFAVGSVFYTGSLSKASSDIYFAVVGMVLLAIQLSFMGDTNERRK